MKCPHCLVEFHDKPFYSDLGQDVDGGWKIKGLNCPSCQKNIYFLQQLEEQNISRSPGTVMVSFVVVSEVLIRPKAINRQPVSIDVPSVFASDYKEACLVIIDSPKASAALSRRCLQSIIRDKLDIKKKDLFQEIQEVIDRGLLPSDLLESLDAVRNIGNFAAHPIKSQSSGEIVNVEPHEAEWNLDVLEMLFDYLFDRPALIKKKKDAFNLKLSDTGKSKLK